MNKWEQLLKALKERSIKFKSTKEWELYLPYNVTNDHIWGIMAVCRELLTPNWHIIFPEPTDKNKEPDVHVWWAEIVEQPKKKK